MRPEPQPRYLVVETATGTVVNVSVGEPVAAGGFEAVPATDHPAAWIGWVRSEDGVWSDPQNPEPTED